MTAQDAPKVTVGALVEVTADSGGWLTREAAIAATRHVSADGGPAMVIVRGALTSGRASDEAARHIGVALVDATDITIFAAGPGAIEVAALIQAAAAEEREFRTGSAA